MIGAGTQHVLPPHAVFANHAMLAWPSQNDFCVAPGQVGQASEHQEQFHGQAVKSEGRQNTNNGCASHGLTQDAHQYEIMYQEDKPNLVRIHPTEHPPPVNGVNAAAEPATSVELLVQEAHRLYREQKYPAVLTLCQHVQAVYPNSTDNLLLMGAAYYHLGQYQQSVQCNDFCILLDPQIAEAHANLANSLQQLGHLPMAALYYQTALKLQPNFADACNNLASIFSQMGDVQRAVEYYSAALHINPRLADVHQNLGDLWLSQGSSTLQSAQRCFREALLLAPKSARAWRGLGDASREAGDHSKAVELYGEAVAIQPDMLEALTGLGLSYKELGSLKQAEEAFEAVLCLQPDNALALGNLAGLYFDQGKLTQAVNAYQRAIRLQPNFPEAYNNLGNTLRELGRADEAIACYTACIQLQYAQQHAAGVNMTQVAAMQAQRLSVAFSNLGGILKMQGRLQDAIACYEHVALLQPQVPEVQANVAAAYKDAARHDQAISAYMRALQLKPDFPEAFANLVHSLQSVCEWRDRTALFQRLENDVRCALAKDELPAVQPFHAMSYPFPADLVLAVSQRYARHYALSAASLKLHPFPHPPAAPLGPGERLRIAYVSSDFANHPLSHLMASVFGMHDRRRVEVFCYALMPSDGSEWRQRIESESEHFIDVSAWPTADIAARISADRIHIAVNLNGYTKGARNEIFPLRPAPVQCAYMGFPATMGADYLPYLITDAVVAPPHLHHCYSESLAIMPHCYFINDYKQAHSDLLDDRNLPKRTDFGLPEDKIVFSCSNQLYKYDPETFATWMRILKRVPDSVLWLLRFPAYGESRIYAEAQRHGVAASRVIFTDVAQKRMHIARSGLADVFLDTPLCNAHTTGCDVLWGGTPTVTLPLERMASRVCASLCMATGYGSEMVVSSQQEYEERAVEFGTDTEKRLTLRANLKAARTSCPLFDTQRWVRNLERVFARMWHIHCSGREPHAFQVSESDPQPGDVLCAGSEPSAPTAG